MHSTATIALSILLLSSSTYASILLPRSIVTAVTTYNTAIPKLSTGHVTTWDLSADPTNVVSTQPQVAMLARYTDAPALALQVNGACRRISEALAGCVSLSPGFNSATPALQAACLCFGRDVPLNTLSDFHPDARADETDFDDEVSACADFAMTAIGGSVGSAVEGLVGFCGINAVSTVSTPSTSVPSSGGHITSNVDGEFTSGDVSINITPSNGISYKTTIEDVALTITTQNPVESDTIIVIIPSSYAFNTGLTTITGTQISSPSTSATSTVPSKTTIQTTNSNGRPELTVITPSSNPTSTLLSTSTIFYSVPSSSSLSVRTTTSRTTVTGATSTSSRDVIIIEQPTPTSLVPNEATRGREVVLFAGAVAALVMAFLW